MNYALHACIFLPGCAASKAMSCSAGSKPAHFSHNNFPHTCVIIPRTGLSMPHRGLTSAAVRSAQCRAASRSSVQDGNSMAADAEDTCGSLPVLVSPVNLSLTGRAPAARWAASLSKTIWSSDQCHWVLLLAAPHPLPKRPPSPMQTDSTLLLQTFWLFSVRSANTLPKFLFLCEYLSRNLSPQAPLPTPLCSGTGASLRDRAQTRCKYDTLISYSYS